LEIGNTAAENPEHKLIMMPQLEIHQLILMLEFDKQGCTNSTIIVITLNADKHMEGASILPNPTEIFAGSSVDALHR
jgi:hypothetical protein